MRTAVVLLAATGCHGDKDRQGPVRSDAAVVSTPIDAPTAVPMDAAIAATPIDASATNDAAIARPSAKRDPGLDLAAPKDKPSKEPIKWDGRCDTNPLARWCQ